MCCHGYNAISHNQNGFVFEEHTIFLLLSGLIEPFGINKNAPTSSIPPLSNGFALLFKFSLIFMTIHGYTNEMISI